MKYLIVALISYILGSLPAGYYIGKLVFKKDIRSMGSGNVGTTNAFRNFGKLAGFLTFAFDFLKGMLACFIANKIAGQGGTYLAMVFAVLGHMYSFVLNFKAGKGIATVFGALVYINPTFAMIMFFVFLAVFLTSRIVSLSSISVCLVAIIASLYKYGLTAFSLSLSAIAILIIIKHRDNIRRLLNGEEKKMF